MTCKWCDAKAELVRVAWPLSREERQSYMGGSPPGSITRLGLTEVAGAAWTVLRCRACAVTVWLLNAPAGS